MSQRHLFQLVSVALLAVVALSPSAASPLVEVAYDTSSATIDRSRTSQATQALSPGETALIDWAKGRFEGAGLRFPEVSFILHDALTPCRGRVGFYDHAESTVVLCRIDQPTLLHELAHAWADQSLSQAQKHRFTELRGLETWGSHVFEWPERATEHAAEVLAWALSETNELVGWLEEGQSAGDPNAFRLLSIPDSDPDSLVAAYEALTGLSPIDRIADRPVALEATFSPEARRHSP